MVIKILIWTSIIFLFLLFISCCPRDKEITLEEAEILRHFDKKNHKQILFELRITDDI